MPMPMPMMLIKVNDIESMINNEYRCNEIKPKR
jgi:hypothetical protein